MKKISKKELRSIIIEIILFLFGLSISLLGLWLYKKTNDFYFIPIIISGLILSGLIIHKDKANLKGGLKE